MIIKPTSFSLDLLRKISEKVATFHHHYHVLYDIASAYPAYKMLTYLEIGCYAGASACLMLQRPGTRVFTVDSGVAIKSEVAIRNMDEWNVHLNQTCYFEGDSHAQPMISAVKESVGEVDILFIDAGHEAKDVLKDFYDYSPLVVQDGHIVFDDYNDDGFPGVKEAVNELIEEEYQNFLFLGPFDNELGARGFPEGDKRGNCFVVRRTQWN
jgi:predicted O-methyltransferase YrrM